jgi:hypothetical protein
MSMRKVEIEVYGYAGGRAHEIVRGIKEGIE